MVRVARDIYEANGVKGYGHVRSLCRDLENFGPCFEGIVDKYVILYGTPVELKTLQKV